MTEERIRKLLVDLVYDHIDKATLMNFAWYLAAHPWETGIPSFDIDALIELAYVVGAF